MAAPISLRPFTPANLPALVTFWNNSFSDRRNFRPISEADFRRRVLDCPAFEAAGLILAWQGDPAAAAIVGLAHALRPQSAGRRGWGGREPHHALVMLYVRPDLRRQGLGSRLLHAAEQWLHYCPVYVGGKGQPCYSNHEHYDAPFFGSSERMGIGARDTGLIGFLSRRGYHAFDAGDVSMTRDLKTQPPAPPSEPPALAEIGLYLERGGTDRPHIKRPTGANSVYESVYEKDDQGGAAPFSTLLLVDPGQGNAIVGGVAWYPLGGDRCGLSNFWLGKNLRGQGLGAYLLDQALVEMAASPAPAGGYLHVELHTHLTHFPRAFALYEQRGFVVDDLWVNLEKT